jgi:hypothetical protein
MGSDSFAKIEEFTKLTNYVRGQIDKSGDYDALQDAKSPIPRR